ncbi:ExbD/TolR family protein [Spiribacter vilamensis]|uniref:Outer membrane transport energization protein ExbD n=1 Tax=Spiribacter vilamensis TaxID=531306 RepID=A0A4Q8CZU0_9GAMM|nr:biopolymer transporter ExbD [Spiribacter vilamensis]RZU98514.1 outer membrane transport energization protein ExbD [Spiribacter vilamensis]TVO60621.1 biopolymer transporter ExbD [Spiribacter vilamensis]
MRLSDREPEAPEINLTPLIDVVFLMLVFFVVTTTFTDREALEITLPVAETGEPVPTAPVEIVIGAGGDLRIDGTPIADTATALRRALASARAEQPAATERLLIRADRTVSHGRVLRVMDQAGRAGFANVSIATTGQVGKP